MQTSRIFIIGATGAIGHQVYAQANHIKDEVIGTYHTAAEAGLRPFDCLSDSLRTLSGALTSRDCVYLLAANVDPNSVFRDPARSRALNVEAAIRLADEVFAANARLVFVSTELIFDGQEGGYREESAPSPITLYGRQKLEVEQHIRSQNRNWWIVRTGATVTERRRDSCPVSKTYATMMQSSKKPARIAQDNVFSITDVRDTGRLLLDFAFREGRGLYHFVATPPLARAQLAEWIIEDSEFGATMSFSRVLHSEVDYPELRPRRSWLANDKAVKDLGVRFASPREVIRRKVKLLDAWEKAQLSRGAP